jgi:hypothetical protein
MSETPVRRSAPILTLLLPALLLPALLLPALLLAALPASAAPSGNSSTFGEPLSDAAVVRIADILQHPERYLDQKIKVAGLVDDVCPMKGCWIDILESQSSATLRFKVEDDVIVFPVEARGAEVVAEGVLRKREMSRDEAVSWLRHLAEEKGETFDESTVTGPMDFFQIEGIGAHIELP